MVLQEKELELLRSELPRGSTKSIAEAVGMTPIYVSAVLSGREDNLQIIEEAIKVRDSHRAKVALLKKAIAR